MSSTKFYALRHDDPDERAAWSAIWHDWLAAEIFAHPAYVDLFAGPDAVAMCAVLEVEGRPAVIMPFVKRGVGRSTHLTDVVGPYGYGGAYKLTPSADLVSFWALYTEWARASHVVSEFHRLHLFDEDVSAFPGQVVHRANNIVRDLDMDAEVLWMDFDHKVRKNVNRAQREGVTVSIHTDPAHHEAFQRIYESTMKRRNAAEHYYFTRAFFASINETLRGNYAYAHAWLDGNIVASELILISGERAYSFLGGTDEEAFPARPNDLLKYEVMRWSQDRGLTAFVLGGGAAPGDGIERYKVAFAPRGVRPFFTAQRVILKEDYAVLTDARHESAGVAVATDYFPAYRAPFPDGKASGHLA